MTENLSEMSDLRLYLLGSPRLELQGKTLKIERRKALALAAYLALNDQPQSREVVASLLWPDLDDERARTALRSTLRALTAHVPFEWIRADRAMLSLNREHVWVDVSVFTRLIAASRSHAHSLETVCDACVESFKQALTLYRADFLFGFQLSNNLDCEDWQRIQREWLRREFADIHRRLSTYYADLKQYSLAINYAQQWLAIDPLHEPAYRQLMRLYPANGQRSEALRLYKQCVELLDSELATPPEVETRRLYASIQNHDLLASYQNGDEGVVSSGIMPPLPPLVIGREEALGEIKRRLGIGSVETRAVTVLQGWPGVGKSTTVSLLAHDSEIARKFPDGILWASLGEKPDIAGAIGAWADALRLSEPGRARKLEDISAQMIAVLREKRVLLIVDDIWQADHAMPFRVGGQLCALVMTTRLNDVASALAPTAADIYRLPVLSESAGLELLHNLTPETVADHPDEARELVHDLEGLPLAIHVAGRLLHSEASMGWGVRDLLQELRTGTALLKAKIPGDMLGIAHDTSLTVAALLKRSTDLLDAETRTYFAYLGLFVPKPATFHLEALAIAWNTDDPKPIARRLVNRGLLEPVSGGRFQMHALLVLHARSLLEEAG